MDLIKVAQGDAFTGLTNILAVCGGGGLLMTAFELDGECFFSLVLLSGF